MNGKEAFDKLTKEQVMHLIVYYMFEKKISLEEITKLIKEQEMEIVNKVSAHLEKVMA